MDGQQIVCYVVAILAGDSGPVSNSEYSLSLHPENQVQCKPFDCYGNERVVISHRMMIMIPGGLFLPALLKALLYVVRERLLTRVREKFPSRMRERLLTDAHFLGV